MSSPAWSTSSFEKVPTRDLSRHDFTVQTSLPLNGSWGVEWVNDGSEVSEITSVEVPNSWNNYGRSGLGSAIYSLNLTLPKNAPQLSLELEGIYSSYHFYVNDELAARGGQIIENGSERQLKHVAVVDLPAGLTFVNLKLEVVNRVHAYGGMRRSILLGTSKVIQKKRIVSDTLMLLLMGACAALGVHYLILFIRRPDEVYYGIFAACGFLFACKEIILFWQLGMYLPIYSPLKYEWMVRAEYWTTFLPLVLYYAFLRSLYPEEHPAWLGKLIFVYVGGFLLLTLFSPSVIFTGAFKYFLIGVLTILFTVLISAWAAVKNNRPAANWLFGSYLVILLVNAHDSLLYMDLIDGDNLSKYGHVILLLGLSALLGKRMQFSLDEANTLSARLVDMVNARTRELSDRVAELKEARHDAEQANEAKSSFLAAASHDLRQPMHSLSLLLDNLEAEIKAGEYKPTLKSIESSVETLNSMFTKMLEISQLDSGVMHAVNTSISVVPLFEQLNHEFGPVAQLKNIQLVFKSDDLLITTDAILLLRVLRNLVSNAVTHTENGRIDVMTTLNGDYVDISVRDTGRGIPQDELENVFGEYYQLDNPARNRAKGLGLGLSIVQKLCVLLDHKISVDSSEGEGSCFTVRVRAVSDREIQPNNELAGSKQELEGLAVLVIDDDEEILSATNKLLCNWGCQALLARGVSEALAIVENQDIDFLLSDYRLEGQLSGFDIAELILRELTEVVPVIILTGDTDIEVSERAREIGVHLMHKPISPKELRHQILSAI